MQKLIYLSAIGLLFILVMLGMWFFPVGRDLDADQQYLHQEAIPVPK
ncbi:hypothetical protein [Commensalibacter nepenthis]|uniref:Uncharacterized protein n=1 Tax=Commensalibacter nepenthis TaxID=3043872 RepID=A0ABT6Q4X8_9PROT|nr:hypothetical protein [Commensalibacter sp. TBRC 10068]MDI2111951.1 hypothetical protein [Commensalibacter sp. TBRC 10068]